MYKRLFKLLANRVAEEITKPEKPEPPQKSKAVKNRGIDKLYAAARAKGYADGLLGKPISMNPFDDSRRAGGSVPFNRGRIRAWRQGWKSGYDEFLRRRGRTPKPF